MSTNDTEHKNALHHAECHYAKCHALFSVMLTNLIETYNKNTLALFVSLFITKKKFYKVDNS